MPSQIAVIIPVYNTGKKKLTKCIYSVLAQTYRQFILILVDEGLPMIVVLYANPLHRRTREF